MERRFGMNPWGQTAMESTDPSCCWKGVVYYRHMESIISIVMPAYNVEAYIAESIASVQAQTGVDWELIVVNDGSTDRTELVVRALAAEDPRIRLVNQCNAGAASARNHGLDLARGGFLAFLDGDDLWREGFLAKAIAMLEEHGTGFCHCGVERLHADASLRPAAQAVRPGVSRSDELLHLYFTDSVELLMGNVVLRATPAVRGLRFEVGCRHGEDTEYLLRALSMVDSGSFLEERMFLYRVRPGSATRQAWDWRFKLDAILAMERVLDHLVEPGHACSGRTLEEGCWRLRFFQYRLLYQMVKYGAWDEVRALLAKGEWRQALGKVSERGGVLHRWKVRIILGQNARVWRLVSFYARNRFWTPART